MTTIDVLALTTGDEYDIRHDGDGNRWQVRWTHSGGVEGYLGFCYDLDRWADGPILKTRKKAARQLDKQIEAAAR